MNQDSPPPSYYEKPCLTADQERRFEIWDEEYKEAELSILDVLTEEGIPALIDTKISGPCSPDNLQELEDYPSPLRCDWDIYVGDSLFIIVPEIGELRFISRITEIEEVTHD